MSKPRDVVVVGIDAAMSNMGFVKVVVNSATLEITKVLDLKVVSTEPDTSKGIRKSHDRLRRGRDLLQEMRAFCYGGFLACAEVPEGSQSADAAWSLGLATGLLCACSLPMVEVSPLDVKKITGQRGADKEAMRQWAYNKFPDAPWIEYRGRRTNINEHAADALAAVYAAREKERFRNFVMGHRATTNLYRRKLKA